MASNHRFLLILSLSIFLPLSVQAATYTVTTNSGGTGAGSLGAAMNATAASGASTSDTIDFALSPGSQIINMTGPYAAVVKNAGTTLAVMGPGSGSFILDANNNTAFDFSGGGTLLLSGMEPMEFLANIGTNSVLRLEGFRDIFGQAHINGGGRLVVTGGTSFLGGLNEYTGGTLIEAGATLSANGNSLGDMATTITVNGGTLTGGLFGFYVGQTIQITAAGGLLSGAGAIAGDILSSNGVSFAGGNQSTAVTLAGTKSYTGNTWVKDLSLSIYQDDSLGSGPATLFFDNGGLMTTASVTLNQAVSLTTSLLLNAYARDSVLTNALSGSGTLRIDNGGNWGSWTFTAANSYNGATTLTNGTLRLVGSGTLGTGGLGLSATSQFDISGAGGPVTAASVTGAGTIHLGANDLVFGGDDGDMVLSGAVTGTGGLIKNGTGDLTLSGSNSYSGGTLFNGDTLFVGSTNGLGGGSVTMASGTLAVTGGPRTLEIGGDYIQGSSVTLRMGLASAFPYDRLDITGDAALSGALTIFNYSPTDPVSGQTYLLLQTEGTVSGRFDSVEDPFTTVRLLPVYEPSQVFLVAILPSFAALAVTPNQTAVAQALDVAFGSAGTEDLTIALGQQLTSSLPASYDHIAPTGILPVFQMGFASAQAQASLLTSRFSGDLSGGIGSSSASRWGNGETRFAGNPSARNRTDARSQASPESGWSLFAERQSVSSSLPGDANAPGYQFVSSGLTAGMENRLSKDLSLGLLLSYGQGETLPGGDGTVAATGGQAGLYGGWRANDVYAVLSASAGLNRYQTQRTGFGGYAAGSTSGYQLSGQLDLGFDQDLGPTKVGLFGSGRYSYVAIDAFTETGSLAPLSFAAQGEASVVSDLGARASRSFRLGDFTFEPGLSLAWEHRYEGATDSLNASLAGGTAFDTTGPSAWTDGILVGARLDVRVAEALGLSFQFSDLVALGNGGSQSYSGGVDFGF